MAIASELPNHDSFTVEKISAHTPKADETLRTWAIESSGKKGLKPLHVFREANRIRLELEERWSRSDVFALKSPKQELSAFMTTTQAPPNHAAAVGIVTNLLADPGSRGLGSRLINIFGEQMQKEHPSKCSVILLDAVKGATRAYFQNGFTDLTNQRKPAEKDLVPMMKTFGQCDIEKVIEIAATAE